MRGVAGAGLGFDVVPPHVFGAGTVGPNVLAGDAAGVAPDALVEVENDGDVGSYIHGICELVDNFVQFS